MVARKEAPGNHRGRASGWPVHACIVFIRNVYTPPRPSPQNTRPANEPPRSPATRTSAHAVPSGNARLPCSLTMSCRRSGTMNSTPSHPPRRASGKIRQNVNSDPKPRKISAGIVNMTPAASDSPAEPVVCTMLFSRIVERPNARRILMESTEMGIEAETVSPARRPTYTVIAPKSKPKSAPRITARMVNSFRLSSADTYVRNSPGGAVELQARPRIAVGSLTETSLVLAPKLDAAVCGGIMPQEGEAGKRILPVKGDRFWDAIDRGIASL